MHKPIISSILPPQKSPHKVPVKFLSVSVSLSADLSPEVRAVLVKTNRFLKQDINWALQVEEKRKDSRGLKESGLLTIFKGK